MRLKWKVAIGVLAAAAVIGFIFRKQVVTVVSNLTESQRIGRLLPHVQGALNALRARLPFRTHVGSTKRSDEEQAKLVAEGKSATESSWHKLGRAVDLYPYGPDGKIDLKGKHVELYRTMHKEAAKLGWRGLAFNADGSKRYITTKAGPIWDAGHIEFPDGMTFSQAQAKDALS